MGKVIKYIAIGYFVFAALSWLVVGSPLVALGFIVILVIVVQRTGALSKLGLSRGKPKQSVPARSDDRQSIAEARLYEQRFRVEARRLAPHLPEDLLESSQMISILSPYLHEPEAVREPVEAEYHAYRRRFLDWEAKAVGGINAGRSLQHPTSQTYETLDADLAKIAAYVDGLPRRAAEAERLLDSAFERCEEASRAVAEARETLGALASNLTPRDLPGKLELAEGTLERTPELFRRGEERPVTALRLAHEATQLADDVKTRSRSLADLPDTIANDLDVFQERSAIVERKLQDVRQEFHAAAKIHAPTSWREIKGTGESARLALEQARTHRQRAAELNVPITGAISLEEAARELHEAFEDLDESSALMKRITDHLEHLEAASLEAREKIVEAERAIDEAAASLDDIELSADLRERRGELLERAAELVQSARIELGQERPDWLEVVSLAERAAALAGGVRSEVGAEDTRLRELRETLRDAKAEATGARDLAWTVSLTAPFTSSLARPLLGEVEKAYDHALVVERAIADARDSRAEMEALEDGIAAFRKATEAMAEFQRAAAQAAELGDDTANADLPELFVWGPERR